MKLNEISQTTKITDEPDKILTDHKEIYDWIKEHAEDNKFRSYFKLWKISHIYENGTVDIQGDICFDDQLIQYLPVRFHNVYGKFYMQHCKLQTFKNLPINCEHLELGANSFTEFDTVPRFVKKLGLSINHQLSLRGIQKAFPECKEISVTYGASNMLSIFLIKGLKRVQVWDEDNHPRGDEISEIFNKNLREGDIHSCQEDLIAAGYTKEARI